MPINAYGQGLMDDYRLGCGTNTHIRNHHTTKEQQQAIGSGFYISLGLIVLCEGWDTILTEMKLDATPFVDVAKANQGLAEGSVV